MRQIARIVVALAAVAGLIMGLGGLSACSEQQKNKVSELVAQNAVAIAGKYEFERSGHPIDGDLGCTATKGADVISVKCIGTTANGEQATLNGQIQTNIDVTADLSDGARVEGVDFVGFVAGQQVFRRSCVGSGC